ncbi:MAG: hypothetical protein ABR512_07605 [Desulfopila sp.]
MLKILSEYNGYFDKKTAGFFPGIAPLISVMHKSGCAAAFVAGLVKSMSL